MLEITLFFITTTATVAIIRLKLEVYKDRTLSIKQKKTLIDDLTLIFFMSLAYNVFYLTLAIQRYYGKKGFLKVDYLFLLSHSVIVYLFLRIHFPRRYKGYKAVLGLQLLSPALILLVISHRRIRAAAVVAGAVSTVC